MVKAIRLLARGQPLTVEQLAEASGSSAEVTGEALALLEKYGDVEYNGEGRITGLGGLTLNPTSHEFIVDGHKLYAWCALDTLFLPAVLGKLAMIESTCPVASTLAKLSVTADRVERLEPAGAWMSLAFPGVGPDAVACASCGESNRQCLSGAAGTFCSQVHFLASEAAAARLLQDHPDALALTVENAFRLGRDALA